MNPHRPAAPKPRWLYFFFVLAAFDVATVVFSLYLNHQLLDIHASAVAEGQAWADRASRVASLNRLASAANAPGNDVFESRDVANEMTRLRSAAAAFDTGLNQVESELSANVRGEDRTRLLQATEQVRAALRKMVAEAGDILAFVAAAQPEKASEHMAAMDRDYADLTERIAAVSQEVQRIQMQVYRHQFETANRLRRAEYALAAAILVMVSAACIYGHRVSRAFARTQVEREQLVSELQAARTQLERKVAERTTELSESNARLSAEVEERKSAVEELQRTQAQLVESSRHAGMAEVATGVLHNVGNVLNSVNVSANLTLEQVRNSKAASLGKVAGLMREHREALGEFFTTNPRGTQLPAFIEALAQQLSSEQKFLTTELRGLQQNVEHIKQIVSTQQSFAKLAGTRENVELRDLLEDALRINTIALERHRIELVRDFEVVPPVLVDRHKVLQILVNLISNAKHALDARADGRRITLRLRRSGSDRVRIEVVDNGAGIAPENIVRIFSHGFTTRRNGHGFGLHSGVNSARELGGDLRVESAGLGQGATFILEFPISNTVAHAA